MATLRLLIDAGGARRGAGEFEGAASRVDRAARRTAVQMGATSKATGGFRASLLSLRTALVALPALFTAVGGAATLAFGKKLVSVASEAEETADKFRVVFRGIEAQAEAAAARTASLFGRSITDVKEYEASLGNLLIPMGFLPEQALSASDALARLAIDLSSLNNLKDEDALRAITSGIAGEIEPLRRLGIQIKDTRIQEELLALGIRKTSKEVTEQEKTVARLAIIFKDSAIAQGNAIETQESYANQLRRLQSGIKDLGAAFGKDIIDRIKEVVSNLGGSEKLLQLVRVGMQLVASVTKTTVTAVGEFVDILGQLLGRAGGATFVTIGLAEAFQNLDDFIAEVSDSFRVFPETVDLAFDALDTGLTSRLLGIEKKVLVFADTLAHNLSFGLVPSNIPERVAEIDRELSVLTAKAIARGQQFATEVGATLVDAAVPPTLTEEWLAAYEEFIAKLPELLSKASDATETPGQAIKRDLEGAFTPLEDAILRARELREVLFSIAQGILSSIIQSTITRPIGQAVSSAIFGSAQGNAFSAGNIIPFASGGILGGPHMFPLAGGRLGLAGEAGPEAVMPLARTPNGDLGVKAASSGSPDVVSAIREQTRIIARAFGGGGGLGLSARQAQRRG